MNIDARGCSCPEPVLMTKRAVDKNENTIVVTVDNKIALQNITRFATGQRYSVSVEEIGEDFVLTLSK